MNTIRYLRVAIPATALSTALLCAACSKPEPPPTEQPPEPQAQQHTELRDSIQRPIDRANAVEGQALDATKQQQTQIDAQTGG